MKWDRQETLRFIGTLGLALLVGGYLRYSYEGELLLTSKILMIAGGVVFVGALAFGFREVVGFFSGRSAKLGTNVATLIVSVIAILGFLNFLGSGTTSASTSPPKSSTRSPTSPSES